MVIFHTENGYMLIKKLIISVLFIVLVLSVHSQSHYNNHTGWWPAYYLKIGINKKWKVVNDVQLRNFANEPLVGLIALRTGINYKINKQWNVTVGGAWFHQQQINSSKQKTVTDELRLWEEIKNEQVFNKWQLINQLRTEQRHFSNTTGLSFRFRYKLEVQYKFDGKWKGIVGNELMWQTNKTRSDWDQNRTYAGAEYAFNKKNQLQLLLMNWWLASKNIHQPVIRINFIQTIN